MYYVESVFAVDTKTFNSLKCDSWSDFTSNNCDDSVEAFMGIDTDPSLRGDFYLTTNGQSPFDRGDEGKKFVPGQEVI